VQALSGRSEQATGCCLQFPRHCRCHTAVLAACGQELGTSQGFPAKQK